MQSPDVGRLDLETRRQRATHLGTLGLAVACLMLATTTAAAAPGVSEASAGALPPAETTLAQTNVAETALARTLELLDTRYMHPDRARDVFTPAVRAELAATAKRDGLPGLAPALDARLLALGTSHTRFVVDGGFEHAFYRSLFSTWDPDVPPIWHLRVRTQGHCTNGAPRVIEVPDGGPAHAAGIQRGDCLLEADGTPLDLQGDLAQGEALDVLIERGDRRLERRLVPEYSNPHRALIEATRASVDVLETGGRRLGYVHIWTGTHPEVLDILDDAVANRFGQVDGVILDLRGGFGGAWHAYLDPFYADRSDYFVASATSPDGEEEVFETAPRRAAPLYAGPLVVLADGGTRSGKEALAHQFRRSERALLLGAPTAGALTAGLGTVGDGWFLYLAVGEPRLDGVRIEGVGVPPERAIAWPLDQEGPDPQRAGAVAALLQCLETGRGCGLGSRFVDAGAT